MRRLAVLPCPESWERMRPDGEGRYCELCRLSVTDVAKLDDAGLDELIAAAESGRRVCARFELVGGHPRIKGALAAGFVVTALAGCASLAEPRSTPETTIELDTEEGGSWIGGLVLDYDGQPVAGALVLLDSDVLSISLERITSERGVFAYADLPAGMYTIQVLVGKVHVRKVMHLPVGVQLRTNFVVSSSRNDIVGGLLFEPPENISPASSYRIFMDRVSDG